MRTTYIWIAAPLLFLGLFLKLTFELREDSDVTVVDERMLTAISTIRSPHLTNIAVDFTALGSVSVIATFSVLAVLLLLMFGQRRSAVLLSIVSASSGVATYLFKHVFSRARPTVVPHLIEVTGFSYPSGHSLSATAFYGCLFFLVARRIPSFRYRVLISILAGGFIGAICLSRLYLGVHFPSDVLSGALLGAALNCFLICLIGADSN